MKDRAWREADAIGNSRDEPFEIYDRHFGKWHNLAEGITCPFCIGIWLSLPLFALLVWPTQTGDMFLLLVSLSGMQAFLQTLDKGD